MYESIYNFFVMIVNIFSSLRQYFVGMMSAAQ